MACRDQGVPGSLPFGSGPLATCSSAPMLLPAEVSAILSEPGVQEEIAGPVNATVAALARQACSQATTRFAR